MYNAELKPEFLEAAKWVHHLNAKWWMDLDTGKPKVLDLGERVMLVVSELGEAMEGHRKDKWDDHLPHRKMVEVELADVVIRLFDMMGAPVDRLNPRLKTYAQDTVNLPKAQDGSGEDIESVAKQFGDNAAEGLLIITKYVVDIYTHKFWVDTALCIALVDRYAQVYDLDLWGAYQEKLDYNQIRADHQRENRIKPEGKKY